MLSQGYPQLFFDELVLAHICTIISAEKQSQRRAKLARALQRQPTRETIRKWGWVIPASPPQQRAKTLVLNFFCQRDISKA